MTQSTALPQTLQTTPSGVQAALGLALVLVVLVLITVQQGAGFGFA